MRSIDITVVLSHSVHLKNLNRTQFVANEFAGHPIVRVQINMNFKSQRKGPTGQRGFLVTHL